MPNPWGGYTKILNRNQAAGVIGDAWTVDVIVHIFKELKVELGNKELQQVS